MDKATAIRTAKQILPSLIDGASALVTVQEENVYNVELISADEKHTALSIKENIKNDLAYFVRKLNLGGGVEKFVFADEIFFA